eukprot:5454071-Heterocapsa_arctica.AAC.1
MTAHVCNNSTLGMGTGIGAAVRALPSPRRCLEALPDGQQRAESDLGSKPVCAAGGHSPALCEPAGRVLD